MSGATVAMTRSSPHSLSGSSSSSMNLRSARDPSVQSSSVTSNGRRSRSGDDDEDDDEDNDEDAEDNDESKVEAEAVCDERQSSTSTSTSTPMGDETVAFKLNWSKVDTNEELVLTRLRTGLKGKMGDGTEIGASVISDSE
jgi:hypothetical protein